MSRLENLKKMKKIRKKIIYPSVLMIIITIFLLFVVDYRLNSIMGKKSENLIKFYQTSENNIELKVFGENIASINITYLRKDLIKIKYQIRAYVEIFQDKIKEVIEQY